MYKKKRNGGNGENKGKKITAHVQSEWYTLCESSSTACYSPGHPTATLKCSSKCSSRRQVAPRRSPRNLACRQSPCCNTKPTLVYKKKRNGGNGENKGKKTTVYVQLEWYTLCEMYKANKNKWSSQNKFLDTEASGPDIISIKHNINFSRASKNYKKGFLKNEDTKKVYKREFDFMEIPASLDHFNTFTRNIPN